MGRKQHSSSSAKVEGGRSPPSLGGNTPLTGLELGVKTTELLRELQEILPERGDAVPAGIKLPCDSANPSEVVIGSHAKRKFKSAMDSSNIRIKKPKSPVRRSGRLLTAVMATTNKGIVPEVEDLTSCDGEEQRAAVSSHEEMLLPGLGLTEKNLEEKITSLCQVVEQLKTQFEDCSSKLEKMEKVWSGKTPEAATSTEGLHEECQKKYNNLMNENRELTKKLSTYVRV
ncbi:hypothetical protein SAY86_020172 [Trapa natans]|uniref:Uncharacterized protein n=1 Tax=Trapa natans TaxID=22666 RepID=A0AAN7R7G2_TRANT|nr:hypothetical protein SAY86_020172 [Trapa natans]